MRSIARLGALALIRPLRPRFQRVVACPVGHSCLHGGAIRSYARPSAASAVAHLTQDSPVREQPQLVCVGVAVARQIMPSTQRSCFAHWAYLYRRSRLSWRPSASYYTKSDGPRNRLDCNQMSGTHCCRCEHFLAQVRLMENAVDIIIATVFDYFQTYIFRQDQG